MNKKTKLLIVSLLSLGICSSMVFVVSKNATDLLSASLSKPAKLDCSYYFDSGEYQSLYELNVSRLNSGADIENATTWGTVTCNYLYYYKGDRNCTIIESTDKYGRHASTVLYDIGTTYEVGSVLTVTGTMTLYDGMSEMKYCSITKDYDFNPSPVETLELTEPLPIKGDDEFNSCRYMGTKEVVINNVRLEYSYNNKSYVYFNDTDKIEIFYGSNTKQSLINTTAQGLNGKTINVHGYLNCYNPKNNPSTSVLQVILRDASDLQEVLPDKEISSLYVTTDKSFYYMDEITMSDFTATVNYTDGTSSIVNNAYITNTVDTSILGQHKVEFAYEHKGVTYTDFMYIMVADTVASIRVDSPVQYYAYNESFITPTVLGSSCLYNDIDITEEVEFSGFDPYWNTDYHSLVFADYTNSAGRKLTTSYEYFVSGVESLEIINPKLEFDLGEQFDYPEVVATYSYNSFEANVSNRVSFTGFDSSAPGEVTVYVSYGNYETNYTVEIIDDTPEELYEYNVYISGIGKYDTGNYGAYKDFEYYRAVKESGYICKLIPLDRQSDCEEPLDGAIYNVNPIKGIDHITFTYKTSNYSGSKLPSLSYGENSYDDGNIDIACSTYNLETTINLSSYQVNYIKFNSGDTTLYLKDITIYYSGLNTTHGSSFVYQTTGVGEYRIAPTVYSGTLVDGVSYVDVPTSFDTSTCTVLSTKRYTYYSYEYVSLHPKVKYDAAMTAPIDVCNYFQAFGTAPANYGGTFGYIGDTRIPTVSEVNSLFGSDARTISKYTRTDGYATSVPYYGSTPTYYELDIDTNGLYTTSNRQVGRIVAWATGFKGSDYGNGSQCVCTYTDDHYATFKEYNNFGSFLTRFNVERNITGYIRGNPTTLSN